MSAVAPSCANLLTARPRPAFGGRAVPARGASATRVAVPTRVRWVPKAHQAQAPVPQAPVASAAHERRAVLVGSGALLAGGLAAASPAVVRPVLAEEEAPKPATQTSPLGVKYQVLKPGSGEPAKAGDYVTFDYVLRRSNGYFVYSTTGSGSGQQEPTKFAVNFQEEPVTYTLGKGQLIAGLDDLLVGKAVGSRVRALVPPEAGYLNNKLEPQPPSYGVHAFPRLLVPATATNTYASLRKQQPPKPTPTDTAVAPGPRRELSSHANQPLFFEIEIRKIVSK